MEDVEEALGIVAATPAILASLVEVVPPAWLGEDPGGGWGPRAVAEHLLDVEDVAFVTRIRRIAEEDGPFIRSIDAPARLADGGYGQRTLADVVEELKRRRADDVAWVGSLTNDQLDRTGSHDVAGTISGRQLVHYWATHDLLHLAQLMGAVRSHLEPHIGGMHRFLEE